MRSIVSLSILGLLIAVSACTPAQVTESLPEIPRIGTTPTLTHVVDAWLVSYQLENPDAFLIVDVLPDAAGQESLRNGEILLFISGNLPEDDSFITPLGVEAVAISSNDVQSLDSEDLRNLFNGNIYTWAELDIPAGTVEPIIPLSGDAIRNIFQNSVMQGDAFSTGAFLGPMPEAVRTFVDQTPGSIGLLPLSFVDEELDNLVSVDGISPSWENVSKGTYGLGFSILGISLKEPDGNVREFVEWVQSEELTKQ